MKLVTYLRRSTDLQEDSLDTQITLCREYAAVHGHHIVAAYTEETVSAAKEQLDRRAAGARLIADVADRRRPFDGIIVLALDRLFRSPADEFALIAYLARHRCELISVREGRLDISSPEGELQHGIGAVIRRHEARRVGQRIKEHNLSLALSGRWPAGQPPLGLTYDKHSKTLAVNDRLPDVLRVFDEFLRSGGNASAAARRLNAVGLTSRDGHPWRDDSVLATVRSPIYRRRLRYDGREVPAESLIPETVPPDVTAQADAVLQATRAMHPRQKGSTAVYSGLLSCAACGSRLKNVGTGPCIVWRCRASKESGVCPQPGIGDRALDLEVGRALRKILKRVNDRLRIASARRRDRGPDRTAAERDRLQRVRRRLVDIHLAGAITQDDFLARARALDHELEQLAEPRPPAPVTGEELAAFVDIFDRRWPEIPADDKRALLLRIQAAITVDAKERRITIDTALS